MLRELFEQKIDVLFVLFSNDKKSQQEEENEWKGFVQTIKDAIHKQSLTLKVRFENVEKSINSVKGEMKQDMSSMKQGMDSIKNEMKQELKNMAT